MAGKTYRTVRGRQVNMDELIARNEKTPAVGNMRVNARGDEIKPDGTIVRTRNQIMAEYHKLHTNIPQDGPVRESSDIEEDD